MTLSALLLIILPLFLIPALLLPSNRIRLFSYCGLLGFTVVLVFLLLSLRMPLLINNIGQVFYPMWSPILGGYTTLLASEQYHLSFFLTMFFFYIVSYLICYIFMKVFYKGSNPNINKPIKAIFNILLVVIFVCVTYGSLSYFLIQIREILPFRDGFLSGFFDLIYPLEA